MLPLIRDRVFYGWVVVTAGLIIAATSLGIRASYGVFFKSIESEFSLSRGATSSIFSVYMLLCCVFTILGGWAMDRYGPRAVAFVMGWFTGLSLLLTGQVSSTWQLFISYGLLLSLGTGAIFTVVNSTTSRWFDRKRGLALGITTSASGLGQVVMAPFAAFLIADFTWRLAFTVMGLTAWVVMVPLSLLLRKEPAEIGLLPDGIKAEPASIRLENRKDNTCNTGLSLRQAFRTTNFWFLGFVMVLSSSSLYLMLTHIVPHAIDLGISPIDAAVILSIMGGALMFGRLLLGKVSDNIGRKAPAIICGLLQVGALIWLIWVQELWPFYLFALFFGFCSGGFGVLTTILVSDVFGVRSIGAIMGATLAGWALGAAGGPAMGGFIFDATGNYIAAFVIAASTMLIATFLVALIKTEKTIPPDRE